jgi:hypothetical protein
LRTHGVRVERVVAVDVDAILYVAPDGTARTAWLELNDARLAIDDQPGFPAEREKLVS